MSFASFLTILIIGSGLGALCVLCFRRSMRSFRAMRASRSREAAKLEFTNGGFYLFVAALLAILLLIAIVMIFGIYAMGESAEELR